MKNIFPLKASVELTWHFDTERAGQGTVVIGLGSPNEQGKSPACILNYKGADPKIYSVTQYVAQATADTWKKWRHDLQQGAAGIKKIVVEDLSLDTCFGLMLFLSLIDNVSLSAEKVEIWTRYVADWEKGHYPDKGISPRDSVACLASLLGHSYLGSGEKVQSGLLASCTFLWSLFERFDSPYAVSFDRGDIHYRRALGRFAYEEEQFQLIVKNGARCQFLVPVQNSSERVLTDAILLEEAVPSAIVKTLMRNDHEFSWTRRGFGLMALYRPLEKLSGNLMTVSVDPDSGLWLKEFWLAVEDLENNTWAAKDVTRPNDKIRTLESYRWHKGPKVNQPWYDGGDLTLVGAPKSVSVNGKQVAGTQLDWQRDILPLLWKLYSPIPGDAVTADPLEQLKSGKGFAVVRWTGDSSLGVPECPTFLAWLAAQSMKITITSPLDLPRAESFEVIRLAGGIAVVHRQGVTLFNDWGSTDLDIDGLKTGTVARLDQQLAGYKAFVSSGALRAFRKAQNKLVSSKKFNFRDFQIWRDGVAAKKADLLANIYDDFGESECYDQAILREALERYWAVNDRRAEALEALERMEKGTEAVIANLREKQRRPLTALLAGVGLGLFAKEILEPFKDKMTVNEYEWQLAVFKSTNLSKLEEFAQQISTWELISVLVFLVFFGIGAAWFWYRGTKLVGGNE